MRSLVTMVMSMVMSVALVGALVGLMAATTGCIEVTIPPEPGLGNGPSTTGGGPVAPPTGGGRIVDQQDAGGSGLITVDVGRIADDPQVELPDSCATHCDCPAAHDCINQRCILGDEPIQCCAHPDCPAGDECWSSDGHPGVCGASAR